MASTSKLPPIDQVPSLTTEDKAAVLDLLFEPSTQLHTLSVPTLHENFTSYDELIHTIDKQLTELADSASTSDTQWLLDILGSHPRLGAKKVDSAQSASEQAQLQGSGEEAEQLRLLNEEYEKTFPGLRYVVFVAGRSRPVIMEDMKRRIEKSDPENEKRAAIWVSNYSLRSSAIWLTCHRQCARLRRTELPSCHKLYDCSKACICGTAASQGDPSN